MNRPETDGWGKAALKQVPNLMTMAALAAGLTAVLMATSGRFGEAAVLVLAAAIVDGLDGRVARRFGSDSDLGAELDSLVDFVNFGVAPALIMYLWAFPDFTRLGWVAALLYTLCCLLRLARFNVGSRAATGPEEKHHFKGVPSPAGAALVMLPLFLSLGLDLANPLPEMAVMGWIIGIGLLMVARFPTPKFAALRMRRSWLLLAGIGFGAALALWPWGVMIALDLAYLGVLAVGGIIRLRRIDTPE